MVVTGGDVRPQVQATDETYIYDVEAGVWTPGTTGKKRILFSRKNLASIRFKDYLWWV